ncbi:MAG: plastocyanin/azurin family copper-binding protein [Salinivirgaceae bacterium]
MKTIQIISLALLLSISFNSNAATHVIKQTGFSFSPNELTVTVGDVIRWEWAGGTHTTTSKVIPNDAPAWDSPLSSTNTSFEYTVTVAGVYNYVCTPHESMGMKGSFTANIATAINENASLLNFSIYPNPVSSFINITSSIEGEVVLSDILGKTLRTIRLNDLPVVIDSYQLDLSDFKNGIYMLTYIPTLTKKPISLKFIKK